MHAALRISLLPVTSIIRILEQSFPCPPLRAYRNFPKGMLSQPFDPLACSITPNLAVLGDPLSHQIYFLWQ